MTTTITDPLTAEELRAYRDPRTWHADPAREGLPGSQGLGRHRVLFIRVTDQLFDAIELRATQQKRPINDVVSDTLALDYLGPREGEATVAAPAEPELTPEVAYENIDPVLKEFYRQEDLKATPAPATPKPEPKNSAPLPEGYTIWTSIFAQLKERVTEENFEIWLSSLRFVSTEEIDEANARLVLQVPNSFFVEYLSEHYTEVIQEVLAAKYSQLFQIEFVVLDAKKEEPPSPAPVETTQSQTPAPTKNSLLDLIIEAKVETLEDLDALEDRERPRMFQARLVDAERRAARSGNQARLAAEVAITEDQRKKQEAAFLELRKRRGAAYKMYRTIGKLRESGNPQSQRQYSRPSHFDTEGRATRADLKDASRAMKTPGKRDLS